MSHVAKIAIILGPCIVKGPRNPCSVAFSPSKVRNFRGRVSYFNQSEARKHCFFASDWLNRETLPQKFRTLFSIQKPLSFLYPF